MFEFIKLQYKMGKITAEQVQAYCPKWITQEQVNQILGENL